MKCDRESFDVFWYIWRWVYLRVYLILFALNFDAIYRTSQNILMREIIQVTLLDCEFSSRRFSLLDNFQSYDCAIIFYCPFEMTFLTLSFFFLNEQFICRWMNSSKTLLRNLSLNALLHIVIIFFFTLSG